MRPGLKTLNNLPRSVIWIANALLIIGCAVFGVSMLILFVGLLLFINYANTPNAERLPLLGVASVILGVPGVLLSVMIIVASFGLRKMKKWGLWCSYLVMVIFATFYILINGNQFAITTPFGWMIHGSASLIIVTEVYLTQVYWRYFTRAK